MTEHLDYVSLSKSAVHSGLWAFLLRFLSRGFGFLRTIILARLLSPEDFGILGAAMLAVSFFDTFSQTGLQSALIQKKDGYLTYLDTAWTTFLFRSFILYAILFLTAPLIASFFNSPQVTSVLRIVALSIVILGFSNIGVISFQKHLEYHKQFKFEFPAVLMDLTVSILLAFLLQNVWALVIGGLTGNCTRLLLSYWISGYRPRLRFDKNHFHVLFKYGKWVFGTSIIIFFASQITDFFVGKMFGLAALGLYQMAYLLSYLPATEITNPIYQVSFPMFSKLQDNHNELKIILRRILDLSLYVTIPLGGLLFTLAPEITRIFFGFKWMPMVPIIRILVFAGLINIVSSIIGPVFDAVGKPSINTSCQTIRFFTLMVLLYPLSKKFGISGSAFAMVISVGVFTIGITFSAIHTLKFPPSLILTTVIFPILNTALMIVLLFSLKHVLGFISIGKFALLIMAAASCYLFITMLLSKYFQYEIINNVRAIWAQL